MFMRILERKGYCFDDVLLVPQISEVRSRKDVDLSTQIGGFTLTAPIISANMATITEATMAAKMHELGGLGILHRFERDSLLEKQIEFLIEKRIPCIPSVGIHKDDLERAKKYIGLGVRAICVDVAHGGMKACEDIVKEISFFARQKRENVTIIAGNVATKEAAARLWMAGASVVKVGVGPGSVCSTRIVTGHGVPQLTAIMDCVEAKKWGGVRSAVRGEPQLIADGGIRNSGDLVKALAAGADAVMIGGLLAGTDETPGTPFEQPDGFWYKRYRGMASGAQQIVSKGFISGTPEGVEKMVLCKGSAGAIIANLLAGVRSGLSYSGASNLKELRENAEFMLVSSASLKESAPHFPDWPG